MDDDHSEGLPLPGPCHCVCDLNVTSRLSLHLMLCSLLTRDYDSALRTDV